LLYLFSTGSVRYSQDIIIIHFLIIQCNLKDRKRFGYWLLMTESFSRLRCQAVTPTTAPMAT
jgi:hypothetical protein